MIQNLNLIYDLYNRLLKIIKAENDQELQYIISQVEISIRLVDDCLKETRDVKQYNELMLELGAIYKSINTPRVGLSDYFIWCDNYDERLEVNESLDRVKNGLHNYLSRYI
ncbi:hypothetical protein [Aneurinibacillus uraniidurans]|uniref:hypothetical protein n=1 Tax=Aneurinibacillus uraniidurans TaxID=2966586 RepID=UPI002349696E|nr:hypothetical protein [Aneurinibacillus sp. B1]WCN36393.1 hypothetical protein PO771_10880 [Aneurinibacillus sp. B1]